MSPSTCDWSVPATLQHSSSASSTPSSGTTTPGANRETDSSLRLPRLLCLHGGGTNARIFRAQCRVLRAHLGAHFRMVFAEAPFPSKPGPDVVSVYKDWGPFKSWVPSTGQSPGWDELGTAAIDAIHISISAAMHADNDVGASGSVIGLLGFSQGAKLAGSLLLWQQMQGRREPCQRGWEASTDSGSTDYRFAVLFAGRGPLLRLQRIPAPIKPTPPDLLSLPTIHVHGLGDSGLALHRDLRDQWCDESTSELVEWNGAHRMPIKTQDVAKVVTKIMGVARSAERDL